MADSQAFAESDVETAALDDPLESAALAVLFVFGKGIEGHAVLR